MLVVIPVVAILRGRGLLVGVDLILTPDTARPELRALPGLEAELFSREIPRIGQLVSGVGQHTVLVRDVCDLLQCPPILTKIN